MPTPTGFFSARIREHDRRRRPPSTFDPTGSTCADATGHDEPLHGRRRGARRRHPERLPGLGGSGCPPRTAARSVERGRDTAILPLSSFNQSLARILYQEQRFGMLGCDHDAGPPSCTNPGGVGVRPHRHRAAARWADDGARARHQERRRRDRREDTPRRARRCSRTTAAPAADRRRSLWRRCLVTGVKRRTTRSPIRPTRPRPGFIDRDAVNPLQQLKEFSGNRSAFTFVAGNDPDRIHGADVALLSTTADSSGLGGLNLSVDGAPASQDTTRDRS